MTVTLVALLCSNLLLGILGVRFLVEIDREYSALVQTNLPLLNDLRSVAWEVTVMQRSINRYPHRSPAQQPLLFAQAETARTRAAGLLRALRERPLPAPAAARVAELAQIQTDLDGMARRWRAQVRSGDPAGADDLNLTALQPRYEEYTALVELFAREIEQDGSARSQAYSESASRFRTIMLGIATWPIWTAIGIGLFVLLFMASLAPLLRRLDS